ncbi:MAG TPA: TrbC/VirB2 family protein [Caulobacteraceae bacterium]|nr:TrbC/VirB2 family protein [Caulobacteraceae bacterium]
MSFRARRALSAATERANTVLLGVFISLTTSTATLAGTTGGTAMPWETPLQTVEASLSGPVAKAVGIIAIVVTGLGFAFAEGGSAMRKGIGIVFGLAIAFTATTFITSFFNVTSGAVF